MSATIYQGQTWNRRLVVTNLIDGLAYNLTGAANEFRMRRYPTDAAPVVDLTIGNGITLLTQSGATLGMADIDLGAAATAALAPDGYVAAVIVTIAGKNFVVVPPYRQIVREMP